MKKILCVMLAVLLASVLFACGETTETQPSGTAGTEGTEPAEGTDSPEATSGTEATETTEPSQETELTSYTELTESTKTTESTEPSGTTGTEETVAPDGTLFFGGSGGITAIYPNVPIEDSPDIPLNLDMVLGLFIECGCDDLCLDIPLHISDLFRTLIYEKNNKHDLRMICGDCICDLLHENCLTGSWRCDDKRPLAFSDRAEKIDDPSGEICAAILRDNLQMKSLIGEDRSKGIERSADLRHTRLLIIHFEDTDDRSALLAFPRSTDLCVYEVTGLKADSLDDR